MRTRTLIEVGPNDLKDIQGFDSLVNTNGPHEMALARVYVRLMHVLADTATGHFVVAESHHVDLQLRYGLKITGWFDDGDSAFTITLDEGGMEVIEIHANQKHSGWMGIGLTAAIRRVLVPRMDAVLN